MCKNSRCLQPNSDVGSTCFIKCIDCNTGQRFPTQGPSQRCTCTVCECVCPAAWLQSDHMKIGLAIMQLHRDGVLFADEGEGVTPEQGLQRFLRQNASFGLLAAEGVMANNENASLVPSEDRDQFVSQLVLEGTAGAMARNAGGLPTNSRQMMAQQFGNTTVVNLPSGHELDTRSLSGGRRNMHSINNRLGDFDPTTGSLPGMQDNLYPDFSTVTADYFAAAAQPSIARTIIDPLFGVAAATQASAAPVATAASASAASAARSSTSTSSISAASAGFSAPVPESAASEQAMVQEAIAESLRQKKRVTITIGGGDPPIEVDDDDSDGGGKLPAADFIDLSGGGGKEPASKHRRRGSTGSLSASAGRAPASRRRSKSVSDDGVERIPAPKHWPFPEPNEPNNPPARNNPPWHERAYGRTQSANERLKQMDVDVDDLSVGARRERKKAKKTGRSMEKHKGKSLDIASGWCATKGVPLSQASAYEKGLVTDKDGKLFHSQEAVKMFRNGYETDED